MLRFIERINDDDDDDEVIAYTVYVDV